VLLSRQRKESPRDHGHLSLVAEKFPWVFSEPLRNACGTEGPCCRRQRLITPFRLGLALTAPCASPPVETLADFHRGFHACWGPTMPSTACYHQGAKSRCAACARTMPARLSGDMTRQGLGFATGRALAELRPIVLQEGRACALHDGVRAVFPGRCTVVQPAAGELPTTLALRCAPPTTVVLPPDTTHAQACLPAPASLRARVLLADRGSLDWHSRRRVHDEDGCFLLRAQAGMHPQVIAAFRADGTRRRSLRTKPLKAIQATRSQRQRVARVGAGQGEGHPLRLHLLISWNRRTQAFCDLVTNLPAPRSHLDMLDRAYTWRWHGEWRLKEGKSDAHLHAFDTETPAIVAGLIGAASAAAARTRFLAHRTPLLLEVPMSTRKVALWAGHV